MFFRIEAMIEMPVAAIPVNIDVRDAAPRLIVALARVPVGGATLRSTRPIAKSRGGCQRAERDLRGCARVGLRPPSNPIRRRLVAEFARAEAEVDAPGPRR